MGEKLLSVPGVGQINPVGTWPKTVRVIIKPSQLQALNLSLDDVEQAIQANHINGWIDTRIRQDRAQGVNGEVSYWGIPLAFLPKDNKNTFLITFHLPDNTPLENTDRVVREIETVLSNNPYVTHYQSFIGIPAVIDFNGQLRGSGANVGSQFKAEIR